MISNTAWLWAVERNETKNKEIRYKNASHHTDITKQRVDMTKGQGFLFYFLYPWWTGVIKNLSPMMQPGVRVRCGLRWMTNWFQCWFEIVNRLDITWIKLNALQPLQKLQNNPNPHWLQYCKQIHLYIQIRLVILRYRPTTVQAPSAALGSGSPAYSAVGNGPRPSTHGPRPSASSLITLTAGGPFRVIIGDPSDRLWTNLP